MKKTIFTNKLVWAVRFVFAILMALLIFSGCSSSKNNEMVNTNSFVTVEELLEGRDKKIQKIEIDRTKYDEVFFDDFGGANLDSEKWEQCPEWERQAYMKKHGFWADECSFCQDGCLILESKKNADGRLISGAIRSKSKHGEQVKFAESKGIYEIKFKIEEGSGYWYAFWLLAENSEKNIGNGARDGAELDCFEILPGKSMWNYKGSYVYEKGRMATTIHWDAYGDAHKSKGIDGIKVTDFDEHFYDNWHIFQFVWGDESYDCYLDGKLLWSLNAEEYGGMCEVPGYIKITAEFGEWGGPIDPVINAGGARRMLVDYVKVYKQR
ncbi:MAG: family 16 glycosylhydrolase [Treponema sp.]|nr:family 16 glycosylhydrolase [Treponema sp.]